MSRVNLPIVAIGVVWWAMETSYFGGNSGPGSVAELFADALALAFYAAAFAFPSPKRGAVVIVQAQSAPGAGA